MNVLVVGGGGREHALAERLAASPSVTRVLCAPGNGGTAAFAENIAVSTEDVAGIVALAKACEIEFVVVGPEGPLVAGLVDALEAEGIATFGPRAQAAKLEGSKSFSKAFMKRHAIPTAAAAVFDDPDAAIAYVRKQGRAFVVKADGLAAGKGVVVADDVAGTLDAIERLARKRELGEAGARLVLEERLCGEEVSYHVLIDGTSFVPLAAAQDHKRLLDGDQGPNTGGMGAYSPPPVVTPEVERTILSQVVEPTARGLRADGIDFRGVLFIGLMIEHGQPKVLEYNVRFGDPETEVLLARFSGDLYALLRATADGRLEGMRATWDAPVALCVVLASAGYPGSYEKDKPIEGLDRAAAMPGVSVQHAGTRRAGKKTLTTGGRVLAVTARGEDIDSVAELAYAAVEQIHFAGVQYRKDIGHHARSRARS